MSSDKPRGTDDLLEQFRELGQQLEQSIRKAWESKEGQEVREQVNKGLQELSQQLNKVVDEARKSETVQDVSKQVKQTVETARKDETWDAIRQEMNEGMQSLNAALNKLIKKVPIGREEPKK